MELRFGSVLREDAENFWEKVTHEIISRIKGLKVENWLEVG
jgi:hypothetical protein